MPKKPMQDVGSAGQRTRRRGRSDTVPASPTLRRRRLARELLRLREEAGLTAKQAAAQAKQLSPERSWFEAKVTRIETRKIQRVRDVDLQTLLDVYRVTDPGQREDYRRLAREASQSGWWVGYRDVVGVGTYVDFETEASRIRTYQSLFIPGLLQVEDYARTVIRAAGVTEQEEIDRRVEVRMMRQHILQRADAPRLWAVIDEAAIRKIPPHIARPQLQHLIDVQRASLRVQILPDSVGPHPAMDGSFLIMDFKLDPPTVYIDQAGSSLFFEGETDLEHYETVYDHVHAAALGIEESLAWMRQYITDLE